jgi:hypothetical protein
VAIVGAHVILYSLDADATRAALRDVGWSFVDAWDPPTGWQIFELPPGEVAVHPTDGEARHQLALLCDDLAATVAELRAKGLEVRGEPQEARFGLWTTLVLPGDVEVMLYEAYHASPLRLD